MLFDPNKGAIFRQAKLAVAIAAIFYISFVGAIVWVAVHFISKFW